MGNEVKLNYNQSKGYENVELVKVTTNEQGQKLVSGRELHEVLKVQQDFTNWIKKQLESVDAIENEDYTRFAFKREANNATMHDYVLTLDIAKEICMCVGVAPRTNEETRQLSKSVRKYFIECEKKAKENSVPQTYAQALLEAGRLALELEQKQQQIAVMEPKAIAYDKFMEADGTYTTTNACKMLGLSRKKVFEVLRDKGLVYKNKTEATQKAIDRGLFKQVLKNGYPTMVITPKGIDYIKDLAI